MDINFWSAARLAVAIRERELSAEEALRACWAQIEKHDGLFNAICCRVDERALSRARDADQATARGESWGPLHGVPMTVKEGYDLLGTPTTWGLPDYIDNYPDCDADAVRRFESKGAVVFAKTNVPADLRDWQSDNPVYGRTVNPWNTGRTPGGSSGGSAVALAAGYTFLEAGSDIGGSLRNPAHYCGVYAHKPTYGVVPTRGHTLSEELVASDISVCGPMARTARDLALGFEIMQGIVGPDATAWKLALPPPRHRSIDGWRIAVVANAEICPVSAQIQTRLFEAADKLARAGATVDQEATLPVDALSAHHTYIRLLRAVIAPGLSDSEFQAELAAVAELSDKDQSYPAQVSRALTQSYREWHRASEDRVRMQQQWSAFFARYDALLIPAAPTTAWPHVQADRFDRVIEVDNQRIGYYDQLFWAGLTGAVYLPSTVAPIGLGDDGLPIGVQIVAPYLEDWTSIELAGQLEALTGGFTPPPAVVGEA